MENHGRQWPYRIGHLQREKFVNFILKYLSLSKHNLFTGLFLRILNSTEVICHRFQSIELHSGSQSNSTSLTAIWWNTRQHMLTWQLVSTPVAAMISTTQKATRV